MTEAELYKELGALTKNKEKWEESMRCLTASHMTEASSTWE